MERFHKGLQLYAIAKQKAKILGIHEKAGKMEELICRIQQLEGNTACFRKKEECGERICCWQAACGATMMEH